MCLLPLQSLGSLAIGVSFGYMSFAMFVMALLLMPIAAATFRVNEGEGHFRWLHARIKEFSECGEFHECVLPGELGTWRLVGAELGAVGD